MGRRYVRDKAGRFAGKGGGTKGKGGKMGKSAKNVKARASYKKASGKLRSMKKISGGGKDAKDRKFWNKSLGGAKSGMTRVTNRLTNKRAAKAKVSPKRERAARKARALGTERKLQKKNLASVKKAKATRAKTAAKKKAVVTKKAEAKKATAAKKKVAAKKKTYGGLTPKQQYKAATSKARAAKSGYAQDRGQGYDRAGKASGKGKVKRSMKLPGSDSARGVGSAKSQVTKLQKKFGKGATKGKGYGVSKKGQAAKSKFKDLKRQRGGVTKGKGTVAQRKKSLNVRTTQQAFGMKVKKPVSKAAQKYIGKQNVEASRVSASRGKGSKAKRRAAELAKKVPRTAKGAMAYDGPNKAASRARDRIIAKTKAKRAKAGGTFKTPKGKMTKTKTTAVSKAYYKQLSGNARKNMRVGEARRAGSPTLLPKPKHDSARGRKKRKGAKTYDNTMSQFDTIKSTKLRLKRKYKYGL